MASLPDTHFRKVSAANWNTSDGDGCAVGDWSERLD